ncbi:FAD-dependent monooxygenase [Streptomyces sp. SID10815]|uniref:FAD-dependent monooxygenase n=1 Tax=Streptomyces sp. SID10815 TaxID=2706027 RepID=UPI0013CC0F38|nr:FAD-dependent monooxygenase [Streptomyces sp. SID10815]NEA45307.1 FAD-binding monooxygenase [Streptomyces sp. SID10815]
MSHRNVLISGAGIAGPALAYWLHHHGLHATVVERAPAPRQGGQTVDLRGAGRDVARRMGLEPALRAAATGEEGIRFVDAAGRTRAAFPAGAFGGRGPTAELEILRADLSRLLYEATSEHTEYLFEDEITRLTDTGEQVHAAFRNRPGRSFDLVVAADGARSRTRDLVFGDTTDTKAVGLSTAYFTIPRDPGDDRWARWHSATGGRTMTLRPDNQGTIRACLSFLSPPSGHERLGPEAQKRLLHQVFTGAGRQAPHVLAAMDTAPDFFFETVVQVRMPCWSRGRVAVVGDAGYCASPLSGMGTSLALVGAYVLAGELGLHSHHTRAFQRYEALLRPYAERAQNLPPGVPRIASPRTRPGIHALHIALRAASRPGIAQALRRFLVPPADTFTLPSYGG